MGRTMKKEYEKIIFTNNESVERRDDFQMRTQNLTTKKISSLFY
jgi:hypothetical protein